MIKPVRSYGYTSIPDGDVRHVASYRIVMEMSCMAG
jgi:hypothetical protein